MIVAILKLKPVTFFTGAYTTNPLTPSKFEFNKKKKKKKKKKLSVVNELYVGMYVTMATILVEHVSISHVPIVLIFQ